MPDEIIHTECLEWMKKQPDNIFDLTMCSPPYEDSRDYGIGFKLKGKDWVDWALDRFVECLRLTNGLVAWVVNGKTRKGRYSLVPERLAIALDDSGYYVKKPCVFYRYGIPGKRPSWLRDVYEPIICAAKNWPLPYCDNTAAGRIPLYNSGGDFSNRGVTGRRASGRKYPQVKKTITPNVFPGKVGKGHMGDDSAHSNEAPYPEWIVEPFVKVFCPPNGRVFDPFCGSGTTLSVAKQHGKVFTGIDVRESEVLLSKRRVDHLT